MGNGRQTAERLDEQRIRGRITAQCIPNSPEHANCLLRSDDGGWMRVDVKAVKEIVGDDMGDYVKMLAAEMTAAAEDQARRVRDECTRGNRQVAVKAAKEVGISIDPCTEPDRYKTELTKLLTSGVPSAGWRLQVKVDKNQLSKQLERDMQWYFNANLWAKPPGDEGLRIKKNPTAASVDSVFELL